MNTEAIRNWMLENVTHYEDECGEIDFTLMVEEWDRECSTGSATLDPNHPAWNIAVDVAVATEDA